MACQRAAVRRSVGIILRKIGRYAPHRDALLTGYGGHRA
jgi:hypothetical protein